MSQILTIELAKEILKELKGKIQGLTTHTHIIGDAVIMDGIFNEDEVYYTICIRSISDVDASGVRVDILVPIYLRSWQRPGDFQPWFEHVGTAEEIARRCLDLKYKSVKYIKELKERYYSPAPPEELGIATDTAKLLDETGAMSWWNEAGSLEFSGDIGKVQVDGVVMCGDRVRLTIGTDLVVAKKIMELIKAENHE